MAQLGNIPTQNDPFGKLKGNTPSSPFSALGGNVPYVRPTTPPNQSTSLLGDVGRAGLKGLIGTGSSYIEGGAKLGVIPRDFATDMQSQGQQVSDTINTHLTPESKVAQQEKIFDDKGNFVGIPSARSIALSAVESTPGIIGTALPAQKIAKGLGMVKAISSAKLAGPLGASIAEGLFAGGQNASDSRLEVLNMPIESLRKSPQFNTEVSSLDANIPLSQREDQARKILAGRVADDVFKDTSLSTGIIGFATGGGALGNILNNAGKITKGVTKAIGKDAMAEAIQEGPQSSNEKMIQNQAIKDHIDPNKNIMDGVLDAGAKGAITGGVLGGAMGAGGHVSSHLAGVPEEGEHPTGTVLNMYNNNTPIVNKDLSKAFTPFQSAVATNLSPTSPEYLATKKATEESITSLITPKEGQVIDPIKKKEGEDLLKMMDSAHNSLIREEDTSKAANELKDEVNAHIATNSPASSIAPVTPIEPTVPSSPTSSIAPVTPIEPTAPNSPVEDVMTKVYSASIMHSAMSYLQDSGLDGEYGLKRVGTNQYQITAKNPVEPIAPSSPVEPIVSSSPVEPTAPSSPVETITNKGTPNANKIESPTEANVSSSTQSSTSQEAKDTTVSREGVRSSGQEAGASPISTEKQVNEASDSTKDQTVNKEQTDPHKEVRDLFTTHLSDLHSELHDPTLTQDQKEEIAREMVDTQERLDQIPSIKEKKTRVRTKNTDTPSQSIQKEEKKLTRKDKVLKNKIVKNNEIAKAQVESERIEEEGPTDEMLSEEEASSISDSSLPKESFNTDETLQLDYINDRIKSWPEEMKAIKDNPSHTQEELDDKKAELKELSARKTVLRGGGVTLPINQQKGYSESKEEAIREGIEDRILNLNDDSVIISNEERTVAKTPWPNRSTPVDLSNSLPVNHDNNRTVLAKLVASLSKETKDRLSVHYIEDFTTHNWGLRLRPSDVSKSNAFIHYDRFTAKSTIYMNGINFKNPTRLTMTFAHEMGHFGVRALMGSDKNYDNFLVKLLNNPKDGHKLRSDILSKGHTWTSYLRYWMEKNYPTSSFPQGIPSKDMERMVKDGTMISFDGQMIPIEVGIRLADEYMADLCKDGYMSRSFIDKEVGLGFADSQERTALRASRAGWLKEFLKTIRHFIKSVFGNHLDSLTDQELMKIVAQSIDNSFNYINLDDILDTNGSQIAAPTISYTGNTVFNGKGTTSYEYDPYNNIAFDVTEEITETSPSQLSPNQIVNPYPITSISNLQEFERLSTSGYAELAETLGSKLWNSFTTALKSNTTTSPLFVFGNMPLSKIYVNIRNIAKGRIGNVESKTLGMASVMKGISPVQNQIAYEYFTTANAPLPTEGFTAPQLNIMKSTKEEIDKLGSSLVEMGMLKKSTYEENQGKYLHTVYLKYLDTYRGSGTKPSFMSYLKKKEEFTSLQQLSLGKVKDVRFLMAETLGIMGRDHVLLQQFNTISKMSTENNLNWIMNNKTKIKYRIGEGSSKESFKKLSLDEAYEQLETNSFIIDYQEKNEVVFNAQDSDLAKLKKYTSELKVSIDKFQDEILDDAYGKAGGVNSGYKDKHEFLKAKYTQLPNKATFGALRNKWVRNEIANDLSDMTAAYNLKDMHNVERFFARGGTLERINQFWKMSKVGLEPGGWGRMLGGNFALLDMSTSTNAVKLLGNLFGEIQGAISHKPSVYWNLTNEYGGFGVTMGAVEMQNFYKNYNSTLEEARLAYEAHKKSPLDNHLHFTDERFLAIGKLLLGKTTGALNDLSTHTGTAFAMVEGAFKTVALRDHIERWEKQNNKKHTDLSEIEKQVLYSTAISHANDTIFDYSQVHSTIKSLRRIPFGSPFITFTYKSVPASIKAMVNQPLKFAKYASLPFLISAMAAGYNDWDDEDMKKFNRALDDYRRTNTGTTFFPIKDSQGRPQVVSLDPIFPWSQVVNASRRAYDKFAESSGDDVAATTLSAAGGIVHELGFMGGPAPTGIAAAMAGIDTFTNRPIVTPGASPTQQMYETMSFAANMMLPTWLGSHGMSSELYDAFRDKPEVNRIGHVKTTPEQAISNVTGFPLNAVDVPLGLQNRKLSLDRKVAEVVSFRTKTGRDRNLSNEDKASLIKSANERIKLLKQNFNK